MITFSLDKQSSTRHIGSKHGDTEWDMLDPVIFINSVTLSSLDSIPNRHHLKSGSRNTFLTSEVKNQVTLMHSLTQGLGSWSVLQMLADNFSFMFSLLKTALLTGGFALWQKDHLRCAKSWVPVLVSQKQTNKKKTRLFTNSKARTLSPVLPLWLFPYTSLKVLFFYCPYLHLQMNFRKEKLRQTF